MDPYLPLPSHLVGRFQGMVLSATGGGTRSRRLGSFEEHEVIEATAVSRSRKE
jgi:hypothetical protein